MQVGHCFDSAGSRGRARAHASREAAQGRTEESRAEHIEAALCSRQTRCSARKHSARVRKSVVGLGWGAVEAVRHRSEGKRVSKQSAQANTVRARKQTLSGLSLRNSWPHPLWLCGPSRTTPQQAGSRRQGPMAETYG